MTYEVGLRTTGRSGAVSRRHHTRTVVVVSLVMSADCLAMSAPNILTAVLAQ
jgi:hypothetical protein